MNKYLVIVLLLVSCSNVTQTTTNIASIKKAFTDKDEKTYLENFPHTFSSFKATFGWNEKADQPYPLYEDANQYIDYYFELITKKHPSNKKDIIDLAIDGTWQADGVNHFLKRLHELVETDKSMGMVLNTLNNNQLDSFWRFYFSKEDQAYPAQLNSVLDEKMKNKSLTIFKSLQKSNEKPVKTVAYTTLCTCDTISAKLDFLISVVKYGEDGKKPEALNIAVSDKSKSSPPSNVLFKPEYWINTDFSTTSYIDKSTTNEGIEKYNKFIVADYNFDGLEDFAIVTYEGGNGGPRYSYFLQDGLQHFIKSKAFPLQDGFFPKTIDDQNKTLTISGPVGCCKIATTIYQLKGKDQWVTIAAKEEKM